MYPQQLIAGLKEKKSYIGVTCHWINSKNFKRESISLACCRLSGHHTYDVVAQALQKIHTKYKIQNKIVSTTTDNGSNFVKAFRTFSNNNNLDSDNSDSTDDENENVGLFDVLNSPSTEEQDSDTFIQLPPHYRCASHTLDLIAKADVDKMINNYRSSFKKLYRKVLGKCTSIWSKQNMSPLVAEKIHDTYGVYLKTPNKTRWNCMYDALLQIKNILNAQGGLDKTNQVLDYCEIRRFTSQEILLVNEYCDVMSPLADTLDFLQSEEGMYMGFLLPSLYALEKKLKVLENRNLIYCGQLLQTILNSVKLRFGPIWKDKKLMIAACLIPRFKLYWLNESDKYFAEENLKSLFQSMRYETNSETSDIELKMDLDFFCLPANKEKLKSSADELEMYLKSTSKDINTLLSYPTLIKSFLEYNTPLPSSAPVERLFSTGSNVMTENVLG